MFSMIRKTRIFILVSLIGALFLSPAQAQPYPNRDITFIVPYGPGGSTDPISRQFASQLEQALKVSVNVENKPGGSATIGTAAVIRAKPDGYTLGLTSNSVLAYQPLVNKALAWKGPEDYQSIIKLVDLPTVIAVRADSPWRPSRSEHRRCPDHVAACTSRQDSDYCFVYERQIFCVSRSKLSRTSWVQRYPTRLVWHRGTQRDAKRDQRQNHRRLPCYRKQSRVCTICAKARFNPRCQRPQRDGRRNG